VPYNNHRGGAVPALTEGDAMVIGYVMLLVLWIVIVVFAVGLVAFLLKSARR
jgi:hypothetical protein